MFTITQCNAASLLSESSNPTTMHLELVVWDSIVNYYSKCNVCVFVFKGLAGNQVGVPGIEVICKHKCREARVQIPRGSSFQWL